MEKITDKYYLGSNKNTYVLYERRVSESGKENFKNIAYISSLENVYSALIEKEIRSDLTLINNMEKICELIKELKEFTVEYVNKSK